MNNLKQHERELLKIYAKLPLGKKEEVLDFVKWIWQEKPKKKISLAGALGNLEVTDADIEASKKSLFPRNK